MSGPVNRIGDDRLPTYREIGRISADILDQLMAMVRPGISTQALSSEFVRLARSAGVSSASLGYRGFPGQISVSRQHIASAEVPSERAILLEGQIVGIDIAIAADGLVTDTAATVAVGDVDEPLARLLRCAEHVLEALIERCAVGVTHRELGHCAAATAASWGLHLATEFESHGVGPALHCGRTISFDLRLAGEARLGLNEAIALEPVVCLGPTRFIRAADGFGMASVDAAVLSAYFEHTLVITHLGPEVITRRAEQRESGRAGAT